MSSTPAGGPATAPAARGHGRSRRPVTGIGAALVVAVTVSCTPGPVPTLAVPTAPAIVPSGGSSTAVLQTGNPPGGSGTPAPPSVPSSGEPSSPAAVPTGGTDVGAAAALASRLVVKGRAPMTGYERERFGSTWSDDVGHVLPVSGARNGCDQRNDVLRRDLDQVVLKPGTNGCVAASGTLLDPYTGTRIAFVRGPRSSEVQIDHVVALADAWQKGAQQWDPLRRRDFAGDPLNLLAVGGSVNQSKGAGDAATWLPPRRAFRCSYAARIVAVKAKYGVWVTAAEKAALLRILESCPGQGLPTGTTVEIPAIRR